MKTHKHGDKIKIKGKEYKIVAPYSYSEAKLIRVRKLVKC